ncbi:MAG TPA: hypothetical protein VHW43_07875, partial [Puia sp.]|nr:hypothetical protein [Puia sp.]
MEKYSIADIAAIFTGFTDSQWIDWIEDILELGYAYPEYRFLQEGDPLRDVINFLYNQKLSAKSYEQAFTAMFEQYSRPISPDSRVHRLLDVMASFPILIQRNKQQLFSLFQRSAPIDRDLGNGQTMQSQLMFIISKMQLEKDEVCRIENHIFKNLRSFLVQDAGFVGNFLRFIYRRRPAETYFLTIRELFRYVQGGFEKKTLPESFLITVVETM